MDLLQLLGYLSALLIGFSLGLIGGGGSILTVPALVYLIGLAPGLSISYSLFIVGFSSLVGALRFMRKGLVNYRAALAFFLPSMTVVFLTRRFLIPQIPRVVFGLGDWVITRDLLMMALFALLMLFSAFSMIRSHPTREDTGRMDFNYWLIFTVGALVGLVTGLVGAGGGFLIIPALVVFARLPMKAAVGTSLLIIALNSLLGFAGDRTAGLLVEWTFLILFASLAVVGVYLGIFASQRIAGPRLKPIFGWFVLTMGLFILTREFFFRV
jgi:uncharacterized protein